MFLKHGQDLTSEGFKNSYDLHFDAIRKYIYYRSGNQQLADDIAQDTFLKVWEKRHSLTEENIKSLLYKISGDIFLSDLRHQKVKKKYADEIFSLQTIDSSNEQESFQEMKDQFEKALVQLNEKQRSVLLMNKMDGLTHKEIAERLDLSVKAVEKRLHLAFKTLKTICIAS